MGTLVQSQVNHISSEKHWTVWVWTGSLSSITVMIEDEKFNLLHAAVCYYVFRLKIISSSSSFPLAFHSIVCNYWLPIMFCQAESAQSDPPAGCSGGAAHRGATLAPTLASASELFSITRVNQKTIWWLWGHIIVQRRTLSSFACGLECPQQYQCAYWYRCWHIDQ